MPVDFALIFVGSVVSLTDRGVGSFRGLAASTSSRPIGSIGGLLGEAGKGGLPRIPEDEIDVGVETVVREIYATLGLTKMQARQNYPLTNVESRPPGVSRRRNGWVSNRTGGGNRQSLCPLWATDLRVTACPLAGRDVGDR